MINPALSQFGTTMSRLTGVRAIMADIIATLRGVKVRNFLTSVLETRLFYQK